MEKKVVIFTLFSFFLVCSMGYVQAIAPENVSLKEQAGSCIQESNKIMRELVDDNFNVQRVNDSLKQAENLYNAQIALKEKEKSTDFSLVLPYCNEIKKINENALASRDELIALEKFYNESITLDMNSTSADNIISEIKQEISSERYEKIKPLVDRAYEEIINIKSSQTTLNIFYKSTTRGVVSFFKDNWIVLVSVFVALGLFLIFYKQKISRWIVESKIHKLEMRKKILKELVMKTQGDYFNIGKMSESGYEIRTKKFAEMIRDIDRQIPLLQEEIMKIDRKKKVINKEELKKKK